MLAKNALEEANRLGLEQRHDKSARLGDAMEAAATAHGLTYTLIQRVLGTLREQGFDVAPVSATLPPKMPENVKVWLRDNYGFKSGYDAFWEMLIDVATNEHSLYVQPRRCVCGLIDPKECVTDRDFCGFPYEGS